MLRRFIAIAVFVLLPVTASAQGFHLSTDLGVTKFLDGGPTGFGLDVYPGYELGHGLVLEGHLGYHRGSQDLGGGGGAVLFGNTKVSTALIPVQVGARYIIEAGPVRPFFAAHLGGARVGACVGGICGGNMKFGINVGSGAEYALSDMIGIGAGLWFHNVFGSGGSLQLINFGVHASFGF